ncbi:hypothetical protein BT1A1_2681 [Caldibacillus thermoamylovorans]|uniref:CRISPR-associated endonuclease Cas1 n=1 Tax=Caldibacillus thermoamylovorans TaxID=35841 RepID=A0A090IWL5_9BACI|nr:CRISPR-associated endonuclease Cas1 [Caldibacillus thermoamylovorans]CEE02476.1 hypothetical protein BT1A1_2681 [Caldibacillus thermoamylovorans]
MLKELIIDDYGVNLHKVSERLVLKKHGKVVEEHAIKEMQDLVIGNKCGMVSISLLQELIGNGTQIHFVDFKEEPFTTLYAPGHHGSVKARREQLIAYHDNRGVALAKEIITTKILNQINTIKYFMKSRRGHAIEEELKILIDAMKFHNQKIKNVQGETIEQVRKEIVSIEAHAAKRYWKAVKLILEEKGLEFPGRSWQLQEPVNMMFNYGYAILRTRVTSAIIRAGLETYAGFFHVDRSGRISFVLDVMEIFRPSIVDRPVISLITRGHKPEIEEKEDGSFYLSGKTLKLLRESINNRLESKEEFKGNDYFLRTIIQLQVRDIASFFRENKKFKGYISRW